MKLRAIAVVFTVALLHGCGQEPQFNFVVEEGQATALATAHMTELLREDGEHRLPSVEKVTPLYDLAGTPALHIVNFVDGGFVIVAGDRRVHPIQAFSKTNVFPTDPANGPEAVDAWLVWVVSGIESLRELEAEVDDDVVQRWSALEVRANDPLGQTTAWLIPNDIRDPGGDTCTPSTTIVGPLMETTWNQGCGYNDFAPTGGSDCPCGHAWAGCTATAAGQIMRFHRFPSSYDWDDMPDDRGSTDTSRLLRDIGSANNMSYGCDGSGARSVKTASALVDRFNYQSSLSFRDYDYREVIAEHRAGRPVYHSGASSERFLLFFKRAVDGHAWVSDGYRRSDYCTSSYLYLHMNWGWGSAMDGYYGFNDFTPGTRYYNYKRKVTIGIRPGSSSSGGGGGGGGGGSGGNQLPVME